MKVIVCGALVLLSGFLWWLSPDAPERERVTLSGDAFMRIHAPQSTPAVYILPADRAVDKPLVVTASATPESQVSNFREQKYKEYQDPPAFKAFELRRDKILDTHWKEANVPRLNQGLESIEPPKVLPTAEEKTAMIPELEAKVKEIAELLAQGFNNQVGAFLWALRDIDVSILELDGRVVQTSNRLGQHEADEQASRIREALQRGCRGYAEYIMHTTIEQIAIGLAHPSNMGHAELLSHIKSLNHYERQYAAAGTEEATEAVMENLRRQRSSVCGIFG